LLRLNKIKKEIKNDSKQGHKGKVDGFPTQDMSLIDRGEVLIYSREVLATKYLTNEC
jgi:hypothetical protein